MNTAFNSDDQKKELYFSHYSKETLDQFKKFHNKNPHIYEEFKMNDKDQEDFMAWLITKLTDEDREYVNKGDISPYFKPTYKNGKPDINEAWIAACQHKHEEIERLQSKLNEATDIIQDIVDSEDDRYDRPRYYSRCKEFLV